MKKTFKNSSQVVCVFDDEGVTFYDPQQETAFPYGCIDSIKISLLGVLQVTSRARVCSFAVDRKDKAEVKEMIAYARTAMKTAPEAESRIIDLRKKKGDDVADNLSPDEKLRHYKAMFVQGAISKEEYEARKRQLQSL